MSEQLELQLFDGLPHNIVARIRKVFPSFEPSKLTQRDLEMWQMVRERKATEQDYETYSRLIREEEGRNTPTNISSRLMFRDFLADRVQELVFEQESAEKRGDG